MLTVKILGSGCPNCQRLETETRASLDAATPNIAYELVKVTDYTDIASYGVMSTPALVMNEKVMSTGRIPDRDQIAGWAQDVANA